jgi:predicted enzyme related to lactoylglutathione lyase
MSESNRPKPGTITWHDLTVKDAAGVRDFYSAVVGWKHEAVAMDGCEDFAMIAPSTGEQVAGICHAVGVNKDLPPQWLMYVIVADIEASARKCTQLGGAVLLAPRPLMDGRFCVIRDPAGAACALYQTGQ